MVIRIGVCVVAALLGGFPAWADGLYESRVIVTGMDLRSRPEGLRTVLRRVLAKVSGDPALLTSPRADGVDPETLVQGFAYIDRDSDLPKHDEQGTRDRPYDLVVRFDPAGVDSVLRDWGEAPWPVPRPAVTIGIEIRPRVGPPMMLRADTDPDERHRGALLAAAERFGVDVTIPAVLGGRSAPSGAPVLNGVLAWSDADSGWVGMWTLAWQGAEHRWGVRGVGFDAAYRDAVSGAVAILSGHDRR